MNVATVLTHLQSAFNPEQAKDLNACFQFYIAGDDNFFFIIQQQTIQASLGEHQDPDVTLRLSLQSFTDILEDRLGGTTAFMTGKLKAEGNVMLAKQLSKLFS